MITVKEYKMKKTALYIILFSFGVSQQVTHTETYDNGNIKSITYHRKTRNGIENIKSEEYYNNGKKHTESFYKDGSLHGKFRIWYKNGVKQSEVIYKDGQKDGILTFWNEIGQKSREITYKDGKKDGVVYYNDSIVCISTKFGDIIVRFFDEAAPKHVKSFRAHVESGYYNGTIFHRVIPGFVIQGGDPNTKGDDQSKYGMGGHSGKYFGVGDENDSTTWNIPAEFNNTLHTRGVLSMARSQDPNSGGSQFFICVADVKRLDGKYTVFGQVIEGMEFVDMIVNSPRDGHDKPHDRIEMIVSNCGND